MIEDRQLLRGLRELGSVRAPTDLLSAIVAAVQPGDRYAPLATPLGIVFVAWNARGVCAVMKTLTAEDFEQRFRDRFGRTPTPADVPPEEVQRSFDLTLLTEFERAVLLQALEIPRGEVRTYGWIAQQIGRPGAVRAVGTALRKNPVPVLIPCHRVVRSDGALGEYALGGSDAKRRILAAEGVSDEQIPVLARRWRRAGDGAVAAHG